MTYNNVFPRVDAEAVFPLRLEYVYPCMAANLGKHEHGMYPDIVGRFWGISQQHYNHGCELDRAQAPRVWSPAGDRISGRLNFI